MHPFVHLFIHFHFPFIHFRTELDGSGTRKQDKFPSPFKVVIDFEVESSSQATDVAWQNLPHPQATPITCFSTVQEQEEITNLFGGNYLIIT